MTFTLSLIIDCLELHHAKTDRRPCSVNETDNALGSVPPSVCPFVDLCVCLSELSCVNRLT